MDQFQLTSLSSRFREIHLGLLKDRSKESDAALQRTPILITSAIAELTAVKMNSSSSPSDCFSFKLFSVLLTPLLLLNIPSQSCQIIFLRGAAVVISPSWEVHGSNFAMNTTGSSQAQPHICSIHICFIYGEGTLPPLPVAQELEEASGGRKGSNRLLSHKSPGNHFDWKAGYKSTNKYVASCPDCLPCKTRKTRYKYRYFT